MDEVKMNEVLNAVADRLIKECKRNGSNTEQILFMARAIDDLVVTRERLLRSKDHC